MDLTAAIKLPYLVLRFSKSAITGTVSRPKGWSYKRHFTLTVIRNLFRFELGPYIKSPLRPTIDVYYDFLKSYNEEPDIVTLEAGTTGGWIGPSDAKNVLLYFHGGGYVDSAYRDHLEVLRDIVKKARAEGKDLGVFVSAYSLAPEYKYPIQLLQAAITLNYLTNDLGCQPQNIFIAGDSAGGNLALSLLSHICHPHPSAQNVDLRDQKLAGVYLMSPWVTFDANTRSMQTNIWADYLNPRRIGVAELKFLGDSPRDEYNSPLSADSQWWQDLPVKDICALAGDYEVFRDDVLSLAEKIKVHNPQTETHVASEEVHVQAIVDRTLKFGIAPSEEHFSQWIVTRL